MKEKDELDKAFRKAFDEYKPAVPADSWAAVKGGIAKVRLEDAVRLKNRYRNLSVLLTAFLLGFLAYFLWNDDSKSVAEGTQKGQNFDSESQSQISQSPVDTVVKYITLYQTDTVYLTKIMKTRSSSGLTQKDLDFALEQPEWRERVLEYLSKDYSFETKNKPTDERTEEEEVKVASSHLGPLRDRWSSFPKQSPLNISLIDIQWTNRTLTEVDIPNHKQKKRELKERIPLKERIFYQVAGDLRNGKLVLNNKQGSFGSNHGFAGGIYAGVRLSPRLWMKTGLNFDVIEYALSPDGRTRINSELVNGTNEYIYRSPLGNLVIPNDQLLHPASEFSHIEIESHYDNREYELNIPLQLNYDYILKDVKFFGYYRQLTGYAGLNLYLQRPLKNSVSLEVYESDGSEFELRTDSFTSISNLSIGGGLQTGLKLEVYPGWKLLSEIGYLRNLTYRVNNEYFQSFSRELSFSAGLEIHLK